MAEVTFNIRSFAVARVRLDPTAVYGSEVAGQPVLHLPLRVRLRPAGLQQQPLHYVIIRFAGAISSQRLPGGEFASFEARPLAEMSNTSDYEGQIEISVCLDRARVKRLEDARAGADANLSLSFWTLVWLSTQVGPGQSPFEVAYGSSLQIVVPKSHWAEQVVSRWGVDDVKVVEIMFPRSQAGENLRAAYSHVANAEKHFANGLNKETLAELYSAFEEMANRSGFKEPDQAFFVSLLTDLHPEKKEKAKLALDSLCDFLHLGRHEPKQSPSTFEISRSDARFALVMACAVFEYITPRG